MNRASGMQSDQRDHRVDSSKWQLAHHGTPTRKFFLILTICASLLGAAILVAVSATVACRHKRRRIKAEPPSPMFEYRVKLPYNDDSERPQLPSGSASSASVTEVDAGCAESDVTGRLEAAIRKPAGRRKPAAYERRRNKAKRNRYREFIRQVKAGRTRMPTKLNRLDDTHTTGEQSPHDDVNPWQQKLPHRSEIACVLSRRKFASCLPEHVISELELPFTQLQLDERIEKGMFSAVHNGVFTLGEAPRSSFKILVKTATEAASDNQITACLFDACRFVNVSHDRFSQLLGVSFAPDRGWRRRPCFVYRAAERGNLKQFLRHQRAAQNAVILPTDRLIGMALDVARALDWVHSHLALVHRDVAARNCYVNSDMDAFLSDDCFSRDLFPDDYHCLGDNANRPIKWMSPEAIVEHKCTVAGDVWAFGVLLWELITRAQQPFEDIDAFEIPALLLTHQHLQRPPHCPDDLWKFVSPCWRLKMDQRPRLPKLIESLESFRSRVLNFV